MINKMKKKYSEMPVQVKASMAFLMCSFLQKGISVITTPIFTRILSAAEYGQYNVFTSWMDIVTIFITFNLSYGVYAQGLVKFEDDKDIFSSSLQGLTVIMIVVWGLIYIVFHDYWNTLFSLTTVQMLSMFILIWTAAVFNFWASEQRVLFKYKALVFITLGVSIIKPAFGIFLILHSKDKVTARILGLVLVDLIAFSGLFVSQMKKGKKFYSSKYWKYALLYNIPLIPHYLSQTVLNSSDRIMIKKIVGDGETGIYSLAYSISMIMTIFNTALMQTISPWIYKKIKENHIQDIKKIAYITLILVAGANLLLIAFAPEAVMIFAPISYYEAIYVIPPVAMSVYFMYMYDLFAKFAFYYEKTSFIMYASVGGAILNIILNYIFINVYGYRAAGYTTLICYMIYCLLHYLFMNRVCDQFCNGVHPYETYKIVKITILFMCIGGILLLTYNYRVVRYSIVAAVFVFLLINRQKIQTFIWLNVKNQN
ncbi:hypothetical protein DW974_17130 [Lachnospiraceae bacterium AM48-27BH]|nr:hypothetical protein DW974_17130 [Lachnospiraceae bacterium AM48-27BH]